jgi:hypothetical protein
LVAPQYGLNSAPVTLGGGGALHLLSPLLSRVQSATVASRSPEQGKGFVELVTQLLEDSYLTSAFRAKRSLQPYAPFSLPQRFTGEGSFLDYRYIFIYDTVRHWYTARRLKQIIVGREFFTALLRIFILLWDVSNPIAPLGTLKVMIMLKSQLYPDVDDQAPAVDVLTGYDQEHLITYLRLLDADAEGCGWTEAAYILLQIDPSREPKRARRAFESHLARAKWMTEQGYLHLLRHDTQAKSLEITKPRTD